METMICISGEWVEVEISVNENGNLVIRGIGSVLYELLEEELVLWRV